MAYKAVHDTFWNDPRVKKLSSEEKLLFLYLITNPHSHYSGVYYLPIPFICLEVGFSAKKVKSLMASLTKKKFIKYDGTHQVVWVINMTKHQVRSRQQKEGVANHFNQIHQSKLIKEYLIHYKALKIPYEYPTDTLPIQEEVEVEEKEKNNSVPFEEIISYLNEKTGRNYRHISEGHRKNIQARWNEGHTLEDFVKVINVKSEEWLGTDMEKHLTPQTLFSLKHFDTYLNQPGKKKTKKPTMTIPEA